MYVFSQIPRLVQYIGIDTNTDEEIEFWRVEYVNGTTPGPVGEAVTFDAVIRVVLGE